MITRVVRSESLTVNKTQMSQRLRCILNEGGRDTSVCKPQHPGHHSQRVEEPFDSNGAASRKPVTDVTPSSIL